VNAETLLRAVGIGVASARANLKPILVLQAGAAAVTVGYLLCPSFRVLWDPFVRWHRACEWGASFVCQAFFCGLLPGLFLTFVRSIRPRRLLLTVVAQALWCGVFGIGVNEVFTLLSAWFGDERTLSVLIAKTAFDQFVWTVFIVAPANAVFYFWVGRDFSFARTRRDWPKDFFASVYLPNLVANWSVWIPVIFVVFAFPLRLQVFVCGLACTFWSLLCLQIGRRSG